MAAWPTETSGVQIDMTRPIFEEIKSEPPSPKGGPAGMRPAPKQPTIHARTVMCYLLCGTRLFQQSMRNTLTNVLIYISEDMEISTAEKGSMLAAIAT
eukprot:4112172-Prymnesium_polylepis.1